jgi:hypothetical protein
MPKILASQRNSSQSLLSFDTSSLSEVADEGYFLPF